jgi:hypothetical protein
MVTKKSVGSITVSVVCFLIVLVALTTTCQQAENATAININFKKWYAVGEGEGSTLEEAIHVADSTALVLLAEKLNLQVADIKDPVSHIRYLSPQKTRQERVGRRRVVTKYYVARVEVRAPQDKNPKQS